MGIKLSEVNYSYNYSKKKKANNKYNLKNASLQIEEKNELICVVGHTGSGKSTLIQHFNLLIKPTFGSMNIKGEDFEYFVEGNGKSTKVIYYSFKGENKKKEKITILKPLRSHVGIVFQFPEYQLFEETVLKDIMFGPKNLSKEKKKELRDKEAEKKAREVSKLMKIEDLLELSPFELSGGQMRKVAIAGILASNPDILVLDEPTVGLDPLAKKELLLFLKKLNEEEHKSIIIVTHDMDVVGEFAKRVIVLNKGEIAFDGSKDDLFRHENVVIDNHLSFPTIITILKKLKERLCLESLDIYKYNLEDAYEEIRRCVQ